MTRRVFQEGVTESAKMTKSCAHPGKRENRPAGLEGEGVFSMEVKSRKGPRRKSRGICFNKLSGASQNP